MELVIIIPGIAVMDNDDFKKDTLSGICLTVISFVKHAIAEGI